MAYTIYRSTFGEDGMEVYTTVADRHRQIMKALTERGYAPVEGDVLKDQAWLGKEGGFVVYATLVNECREIFFMTQDGSTADRVSEALRFSIPGVELMDKVSVSVP